MSNPIQGVIPVAHTPFSENDEIDFDSLGKQVEWAIEQQADGYCTGMVSELLRLTPEERTELTRELANINSGRVAFVASVGAECTKQAVAYAEFAEQVGCQGVMAIPPLSTALPNCEIVDYFSAIANAIALPVIVQDASGYVGQAIPMEVYLELLHRFGPDRILFKPEASPVGPTISTLRSESDQQARIFDGSGGNLLIDAIRRGVTGTIPGMEFLSAVIAVWNAMHAGDERRAYEIYFPLNALVTLQLQAGLDGFLAVEKYVLQQRGLFAHDARRRPHAYCLDEPTRQEVDRLLGILDARLAAVD